MHALRRTATLAGKRQGHHPIVASVSSPLAISPAGNDAIRGTRRNHTLRPLPYDIEEGLGDFLSPEALKIVAVDYQQGLLQRLNEEVDGTELKDLSVAQTVISAASNMENILAWNYASQALNNSFFFDNLLPPGRSPPPLSTSPTSTVPLSHEHTISSGLHSLINESFGSLTQLKSSLSAAAQGLMGSGWIWLVCDQGAQHLGFVASYGPGTLLVRNRQHRHPEGLDGASSIGATRTIIKGAAPTVLGEKLPTSGINASTPAQKDFSPLGMGPSRGGLRSFHHSSSNFSPLPSALLQGLNVRQPRFSQTSPAWAPLEPLSKAHSRPGVLSYSTRPADEADEEGITEDQDKELEKETEVSPWEEGDGAKKLFGNLGTRSIDMMQSVGERANAAWDRNRARGVGDDLSPLLCISVHEHMWLAGGYGIWGKEEYLNRYWSVVNWAKVSRILELWTPNSSRFRVTGSA